MKKKILIIFFLGVILDRLSKILITSRYLVNTGKTIISNFFSITYAKNYGAAWSILNGNRLFLIVITLIVLFFLIMYIFKEKKISKIDSICYGLILGGIVGNFIDRIFFGYVIDFLDFTIFGYDFPIFNIADSLIVIGVIIMIISSFIRGDENESNNK